MRTPIIGVVGPGREATAEDIGTAYDFGLRAAQKGWIVLTGGSATGVMDAALRGAKNGGKQPTLGITSGTDRTKWSPYMDIPIVTCFGQGRNLLNVLTSSAVVAIGIDAGTSSEVSHAITEDRHIILLRAWPESAAYFRRLVSERSERRSFNGSLSLADSPEKAVNMIEALLRR